MNVENLDIATKLRDELMLIRKNIKIWKEERIYGFGLLPRDNTDSAIGIIKNSDILPALKALSLDYLCRKESEILKKIELL
jgi:hypothetical protein